MNLAHLRKSSPFYDLFPSGMAPIVNVLVPTPVLLEGDPEQSAYMLDWQACASQPGLQHAIAERIVQVLGRGTVNEVLADAERRNIPIRASQVVAVSTDVMWFL